MRAHMFVVCMHVCSHAYGPMLISGILYHSYLIETESVPASIASWLAAWGWQSSRDPLVSDCSASELQTCLTMPGSYMGVRDSNSGPDSVWQALCSLTLSPAHQSDISRMCVIYFHPILLS